MLAALRTLLSPQRKNEDGSFPTIHIQKGKNPVRLPAKINMALFQPSQITAPATQNRHAFHSRTNKNKHHSPKKRIKHQPPKKSKNARISRACQRKLKWFFSNHHKTLRLPRKMHVLRFIGGRR